MGSYTESVERLVIVQWLASPFHEISHETNDLPGPRPFPTCKSAIIRQKNFGPKALSTVSMLIEPGFIRQHRLHGRSDKPTGVSLGSISLLAFDLAVRCYAIARFTFPKFAEKFDEKLYWAPRTMVDFDA